MRAISLWQPWASAVAFGSKRIETRHWSTDYRGPLAIHAAQRMIKSEMNYYGSCWNWCAALAPSGKQMGDNKPLWALLPFGAIVAVCKLVDCRPTAEFTQAELDLPRKPTDQASNILQWTERQMGNFELGRFGWVLSDVRLLSTPIPFTGRQGFFNVPDDLLI